MFKSAKTKYTERMRKLVCLYLAHMLKGNLSNIQNLFSFLLPVLYAQQAADKGPTLEEILYSILFTVLIVFVFGMALFIVKIR